ncbi:MAG TPA: DEAD/DEAH box helicase, partial [Lentisphaeria bacterium]|nr:DEAD/DEAH box helicase [Lentisphaeria bacterium]
MSLRETERFFGSLSSLCSQPGRAEKGFAYEPRPQQVAMAVAVAKALDQEENLCVEAPTGVGKTFAYLVPAYYHATASGKPVVISTHTINLQEQILGHDVPLLSRLLGVDLKAVVAKGRGNYLCLRRFAQLLDLDQELLPGSIIKEEIGTLQRWAESTKTGDRADLSEPVPPALWTAVCSESVNCLGQKCIHFRRCFVTQARQKIRQAQIVVANHAFLFSALAMEARALMLGVEPLNDEDENRGLLPDFSALVLDEGHTLEECASMHLGQRADTFVLRRALNRLYNEERKTGLLSGDEAAPACVAVKDCRRRAALFFDRLLFWLEPQNQNPLRYTCPNHIDHYLGPNLTRLVNELDKLIKAEDDPEHKAELQAMQNELAEQNTILETFFAMSLPG